MGRYGWVFFVLLFIIDVGLDWRVMLTMLWMMWMVDGPAVEVKRWLGSLDEVKCRTVSITGGRESEFALKNDSTFDRLKLFSPAISFISTFTTTTTATTMPPFNPISIPTLYSSLLTASRSLARDPIRPSLQLPLTFENIVQRAFKRPQPIASSSSVDVEQVQVKKIEPLKQEEAERLGFGIGDLTRMERALKGMQEIGMDVAAKKVSPVPCIFSFRPSTTYPNPEHTHSTPSPPGP
jgi:hypothetical protein